MEVLTAVIFPVPKRLISLADSRLEIMVPPEISIEIRLAQDTGMSSSL